jgi:S-methylmethionine-dependent homocysteine/selenocysteine methylase
MSDITLLDGSIGQELVARSNKAATPLWSTSVMMDRPDLVGALHRDYFAAGATVATTNTYAVHESRLVRVGLADQVPYLLDMALTQAATARDAHGSGRIAGSLGPLLASYRPDLQPDIAEAGAKFGAIAQVMRERVDLFLIETASSVQEAEGALEAVRDLGLPVWLGLSTMDNDGGFLRSGEPLRAVERLIQNHAPDAVLINCTRPEAIPKALGILADIAPVFGAYANGFTRISDAFLADAPTVDVLERRTDLGPQAYADHAMAWVESGATIVGGCCEVGPGHIAELARRLRAAGHRIV